ncbi:hypothetical protein [Siminovitchia fortis]|uniref:hypothetical protein n=1 Tax=Siminovitchia fortis TaxID=254758 RepID=UPI0011A6F7F7|nr:hypothetical protein [Siminovitchia fortis]
MVDIGEGKEGERVVVSGGGGGVGCGVGEIGKIKGGGVVGIGGWDEKMNLLKEEWGFDEGMK